MKVAPWAGIEPATIRLTVECSTAELPGNNAGCLITWAYNKSLRALQSPKIKRATIPTPQFGGHFMRLEATPGIEPGYADLQSAASPLRHVAVHTEAI